jgi:hypothetical protein
MEVSAEPHTQDALALQLRLPVPFQYEARLDPNWSGALQ